MSLLLLFRPTQADAEFEVVTEVFLDGLYSPMTALGGRYAPSLGLGGHYMPESSVRGAHRQQIHRPGRS